MEVAAKIGGCIQPCGCIQTHTLDGKAFAVDD